MIAPLSLLFGSVALSLASPLEVRTVSALNTAAFEEAQQKDTTATKIFSSTEIEVCSCYENRNHFLILVDFIRAMSPSQ